MNLRDGHLTTYGDPVLVALALFASGLAVAHGWWVVAGLSAGGGTGLGWLEVLDRGA
jgi:hypothetical protein